MDRFHLYAATLRHGDSLVSCALICPQASSWTYIECLEPPEASSPADHWRAHLRKVPGAIFVRNHAETLPVISEESHRLARLAGGRLDAALLLKVGRPDADLPELLGQKGSVIVPGKQAVAAFRDLYCGRRKLPTPPAHALLTALELAAADPAPQHHVLFEEIKRLELLLGTKNAQSLRAWFRRKADAAELTHQYAARAAQAGSRLDQAPSPAV